MDEIIEGISALTVLELAGLVKALEEKFGVTAAAPVAMMAAPGAVAAGPAVEEQTEFDAILQTVGEKKIQVIKVVRELTALGLKEAKDLVDGAPKSVKEKVSRQEAETIKQKLEAEGATVVIK
jgi:large subunit ribosomal protein L7/L12